MILRRGPHIGTARVRAAVLDPVCRMEIRQEQVVASATVDGWRRFDFCSLPCHEAFLDTPHAFVGWADRQGDRPKEADRRPLPPYPVWGDRPR